MCRSTIDIPIVPPAGSWPLVAGGTAILLAGFFLGACQRVPTGPSRPPAAERSLRDTLASRDEEKPAARAPVEAGAYAEDGRVEALLARWPAEVRAGLDTLAFRSGLEFPTGAGPEVTLRPIGDEDRPWRLGSIIEDGRRVPQVDVNLEWIAAGRETARTTLLRALAAAVFEDVARRHGPVAPWVVRAAEIQASGELAARLRALARAVAQAGEGRLGVDPDDPSRTEATALAALLVLEMPAEGGSDPFFRFAAEGDEPGPMLARRIRDPLGSWAGAGRARLDARIRTIDSTPWQVLVRAREAVETLGRAGLEAELPERIPPAIAGEVAVLRARAASAEGDLDAARDWLGRVGEEAWGRLDDPAAARALRIRVERMPGGDPILAARLEVAWVRDFPRRAARTAGPAGEAPGVEALRARLAEWLADYRAGAARRMLEALGEKGTAPELEDVARAVAEAEERPSAGALAANRARVRAWVQSPSSQARTSVLEGGTAAAEVLAALLPPSAGPRRREMIRLLAQAATPDHALPLLVPAWQRKPELLTSDLDTLLGVVPYGALKRWIQGLVPELASGGRGVHLWGGLRYFLDEPWVQAHPEFLLALHASQYARRRDAFESADRAGRLTPDLVAWGLEDPAILLRRRAARAAGERGFAALAQRALHDEAWAVRQAGVGAVLKALDADAAAQVLLDYRQRPLQREVRRTVIRGLVGLGAGRTAVVDALVEELAGEDDTVREDVVSGLLRLPPADVLGGLTRAMETETRRPRPRKGVVSRYALLYQRVTGDREGYTPGLDAEGLAALLERMRQAWSRALRTAQPRRGS
ncbi:MAG: hypothetical protein ACC662_05910 [Planctomycetota bacterium]